jgi:hypothetical protein
LGTLDLVAMLLLSPVSRVIQLCTGLFESGRVRQRQGWWSMAVVGRPYPVLLTPAELR